MTQTVPRSLHSWHTLWPGIDGFRPIRKALMTSSSWPLSIGQPRSSKSTGTWALIGVEVASVFRYSGLGYTAAAYSPTSAKFRRAWMPPAVAQAPIVTRRRERRRTRRIRSASAGVVIEPSTSERSYGPRIIRRDASAK